VVRVGGFICKLHEKYGVTFHFGTTATLIDESRASLGAIIPPELVVIVGVRPVTSLAEQVGSPSIVVSLTVDEYP
jgi:NADPH-dependent 2,4-dienoyl-CoA reductase/sulfur reductase-like enzyme